ncbi:MAG: hypothetical protein GEU90_07965 [Gemmatimonas sp.]|nr:hypothetical protein [Gemmatimonas sp.]
MSAAVIVSITLAGCSPDRLEGPDPTGPAALAASPAQAMAGLVNLTCLGTNDAQFSPGLTFQTQTVDIEAEGEYTTCLSSDPAVTSGIYTASGEGTLSCLAGGHAGQFTITWNTGESSTVEFTNSLALRPGGQTVVTATGTVIGGKFVGDRFDGTFTLFQLDVLACLTPQGVRSASGPATLLFTSL